VSPIQCPIEKRIEGVNDRARVTASLRLEQLLADQSVNFTIAYFKREAAQAFPPPLSVRPGAADGFVVVSMLWPSVILRLLGPIDGLLR
jgi:hypothetical protein